LILAGKYTENQILGLAYTTVLLCEGYQPDLWVGSMGEIVGYADFPAGQPLVLLQQHAVQRDSRCYGQVRPDKRHRSAYH
jgi:hypothetical protein